MLGPRNAMRQPNFSVIYTISGGVISEPIIEPALNTPTAKARSRAGNHSDTTFMAPEKLPHSPVPIQNRTAENWNAVRAKVCNAAASDHHTTEKEKPLRAPMRSISQPTGNSPTIMPNMKAETRSEEHTSELQSLRH